MAQNQFVPLAKQSKQARRKHFLSQRGSWDGVVPVTRRIPDKRKARREKELVRSRMEDR